MKTYSVVCLSIQLQCFTESFSRQKIAGDFRIVQQEFLKVKTNAQDIEYSAIEMGYSPTTQFSSTKLTDCTYGMLIVHVPIYVHSLFGVLW